MRLEITFLAAMSATILAAPLVIVLTPRDGRAQVMGHGAAAAGNKDDDILGGIGDTPAAPAKKVESSPPPPAASPRPSESKPAAPKRDAATSPAVDREAVAPGIVDRVKAVPRKALLKRHRLELTPYVGVSLNDPYFEHLSLSGTAVFYPHDNFGIGLGVDYMYAHLQNNNVDAVRTSLTSVLGQFDQPRLFGHLDLYWLPIYGKVSLFDSAIINFDLYASAGGGFVETFGSRTPFEVNVAVGQHYVLEQWLSLRFEVRDHLYLDHQSADELPRSSIQSYVMFLAGLSFFIPPTFEYTVQ